MQQHFVGNLKLKETDTPGSESWSTKVRRRARVLMKTLDTGYMEMAEILYTVYNTRVNDDPQQPPIYTAWGFESFADYAASELGLHKRKAERLRRIYFDLENLREEGLDPKLRRRIIELGWSKVREVLRVVSVTNAEQWIDMAETLNYEELTFAVRQALEAREAARKEALERGEEVPEEAPADPAGLPEDYKSLKSMPFSVFPGQKETIDQALERASQITESVKKGHNLEMICTDFLATNDFRLGTDPERTLKYIAKFERLMGRKFVVVDPDTLAVEYGIGVLEDMAAAEED